MRIILILLFLFTILGISHKLSEARVKGDIFEVEIKLYTNQEIKEFFPRIELEETNIEVDGVTYEESDNFLFRSRNYNYLFGWIRLKEELPISKGLVSLSPYLSCKITMWNKFFRYTFKIENIGKEKSYFLIPIGNIGILDRNFEYHISTIP